MATTGNGFRTSFKAAVDLSAKQWHFVKCGSVSGEVNVATGGSGPYPIGILENNPVAGEEAIVCVFGITKVSACAKTAGASASAIAMGSNICSGPLGTGVKGTCAINAIALESLATGGTTATLIKVFLLSPGSTIVGTNVA